MVAPWCAPAYGTRLAFAGAGALLCALTALAVRAHRRGRVEETPVLLAAGTALAALTLALSVLPRLEPFKVSPRIARAIREHTADDVPVATYRYGEPSLTFYLDRGALQVLDQEDEVVAWLGRPAPGVLVLPARHLQLITRAHPLLRLEEIAWARGFNYSVGRWIDLVAVGRPGP
jgi:hypothetical protein